VRDHLRGTITALLAVLAGLMLAGPAQAAAADSLTAVPSLSAAPGPGMDAPARSDPRLAQRASSKPLSRGKLHRKLARLARKAPAASGFYVYDIDAKKKQVLFDHSQGRRRKLASNEKLFTTTTALHVLGAGGTIATRVKRAGTVTKAGRLKGNLYLVGGGDPSFGADGVSDLAHDVRRAGIKRVSGTVYGDDSVFDRLRGVPGTGYSATVDIPPMSGLTYGGSTYSGDPAKAAAAVFRDKLRDVGVKIGGKVRLGRVPKKLRGTPALGEYESPPIAALVAATNKPSNNFYAEMLLKRLAADEKHQGTTAAGVRIVEAYARQLGSKVSAQDGSGLTSSNKAAPKNIVRLLSAVRRIKGVGDPLFDSLAIAGKDGTLVDRMGGTAAAGRCRGKTGTITGVSNLSGYCRSGHGLVAFSFLMNGVGDYDYARAIQDKMAVEIARYRP
jgi:D-alanyl-D-alanine carboxypeptidase/D-alanyl-D-alanine-endopeptidase (penicillin-binding protein 4)